MYYSLRMAPPRHELFLLVGEADGSVRECLADYYHKGVLASSLASVLSCHYIGSIGSLLLGHFEILQEEKTGSNEGHANVHLSHVTSARMISPILPPEARYVTART